MTILIIEGIDGSGKSTLVRDLRSLINGVFLSTSGPPGDQQLYRETMWIQQKPSDTTLVLDRFRLTSELVYGPLLRGSSRVDKSYVLDWFRAFEPIFVLCDPGLTEVRSNIIEGKHLEGVADRIPAIYEAYQRLCIEIDENHTRTYIYDYTHLNAMKFLLEEIKPYVKLR